MNLNEKFQLTIEYYQAGDLQRAEHLCWEILKDQPNYLDALHLLGILYLELGNYDFAINNFEKAIQLNPSDAYLYYNLGNAYREKGQYDSAICSYQKSFQLDPNLSGAYYNLGIIFQETGQLDEAIASYQKALELNPNAADVYNNLGCIFQEKKLLDKAITCYKEAIHLNQSYDKAYYGLGSALQEKGQLDEAIICYQEALKHNPYLADTCYKLGTAFEARGQLDEAITNYENALKLNRNAVNAHMSLGRALLKKGNFKEVWKIYDWRCQSENRILHQRNFSQPLWDGSDITDHIILLHAAEWQGYGDTIQFIRYAPLVAQRNATVIIECKKELKSLLQNVEGVYQAIDYGTPFTNFDIHCPLLSLPVIFDTTLDSIPSKIPYINADPALIKKWKDKIKYDNSKLKIGLVWSSHPQHCYYHSRSCSLEIFSLLSQLDNVTFYSLQKEETAKKEQNLTEGVSLVDFTEDINNFSDTAAFVENLDLIISVDTAVAHLAGALGKPVWTLISFSPDWRWMLNREDSPWYPTMRLFRQSSPGDWESVIFRVKDELLKLLGNN